MRRGLLALLAAALLGGCAGGASGAPPARGPLVVLGAASLGPALDRIATAYEAARPGTELAIATDSSAALATQVREGAPADLFLAADTTHPAALVEEGFATGGVVAFAANELAVVVPRGNPAGLATPADLGRDGVRIVAAGEAVPITAYARRLVDRLGSLPGYPPGFAAAYEANVVSREDNVKAVLAKVELGEGDAGIVYATDAAGVAAVERLEIPAGANVTATYGGVVVAASPRAPEAAALLDWIAGPEGAAILAELGFLPAP